MYFYNDAHAANKELYVLQGRLALGFYFPDEMILRLSTVLVARLMGNFEQKVNETSSYQPPL